ncbi:MAG: putative lipid II flippase FtsW [Holophagaceae bacterium]|nr:putative lipid II flippase FtsW [Holophagaceae bacterium]
MDVRRPIDRLLLFFAVLLMAVGMVWIYSASAVKASQGASTATAFLVRQLIGGGIGIALVLALSQVDLNVLKENPRILQLGYVALVILLMSVFGFAKVNNAHRWIRAGFISLQPSELFKPFAVLLAAWWMVRHQETWARFEESLPKLLLLLLLLALPLGLILLEPDFGTTALTAIVIFLVIYLGGLHKWVLTGLGAILAIGGGLAIAASPYRMARFLSFLNPEADPLGKGHQALQSLVAVGNGGLTGVGMGAGRQKLFFLPEAHNDFIFAVIAEETGLLGTVIILSLFCLVFWRGYRIARRVREPFLRLCAMGFTLLLVLQALMNMSVVLSIAPNKGIPLPFISYGPTSLIASLICLGLLLSISKEASA